MVIAARPRLTAEAVVVGAGLGGLLAAARLARAGRRVVVLERADRPGGRFTATPLQGAEVSSGALHLIPHGSRGPLARLLRQLGLELPIADADVFASFWIDGRHTVCRSPLEVLGLLGWRQRVDCMRLLARSWRNTPASFESWLSRVLAQSHVLYRMARAMCEFALSLPLEEVSYREARAVLWRTWREGLPGVPLGGCRAVVEALVGLIESSGGRVLLEREAVAIELAGERAAGVSFRDRRSGAVERVDAGLVVSDLGPDQTLALCGLAAPPPPRAGGLKIQFLSPVSLIPHASVMFTLGTERIAGIVQPSNGDPALAPPGHHLLMSHQVLRSGDHAAERAAGLRDLRRIFGPDFDRCRVLTSARYLDQWPVNRAAQGQDWRRPAPIRNLAWVGDAFKPRGYMMVEGIAEGVRRLPL
jgi:phytoene dehydrogenase-like protein